MIGNYSILLNSDINLYIFHYSKCDIYTGKHTIRSFLKYKHENSEWKYLSYAQITKTSNTET